MTVPHSGLEDGSASFLPCLPSSPQTPRLLPVPLPDSEARSAALSLQGEPDKAHVLCSGQWAQSLGAASSFGAPEPM